MKTLLLPLAAVVLLTGCSAAEAVELSDVEHIHNVATDGDAVYLGTHGGLFKYGESWELVGESFDVMGFTINGDRFLASGHPGENMDLPDPLGLIASDNQGQDWQSLGLTGEVDFHYLRASAETVIGVAANYGMLVSSTDGGQSWSTIETTALNDLSINPNDSQQVLIASEGKLLLTDPLIENSLEIETSFQVDKLVWFDRGIVVLSGDDLFFAENLETEFQQISKQFDAPMDISAKAETIVVRDSQGVHLSKDLGGSFELIYSTNTEHSDDEHED